VKRQRKIGLFDSGLGGLTVLHALEEKLPGVDKVYYGDTLHLPYGDKSDEAIRSFSREIVWILRQAQGCDVIVIACNSASAAAGSMLEESFPDLTFINVIDPVVAALAVSAPRKTALLGTRATVRSGAYAKRLAAFKVPHELVALPTPLLVPAD
jgi:glutamate racemase